MSAINSSFGFSPSPMVRLTIRTIDRCGRIISSEGESADEGTETPFPDRPLKLGESFSTAYEGSGASDGQRATTHYTLTEVVSMNGRQAAVLKMELSGDIKGTGTTWLDLETGLAIKSTLSGTSRDAFGGRLSYKGESRIAGLAGE